MREQKDPKNADAQRIGAEITDKIEQIQASIRGIEAGEKAQEKQGLPEEWARGGLVEEKIRDYVQTKHTYTSDDVWKELLDPLISNGEIPLVENRRVIGPMFKRLVEDGFAVDSEFAVRSKRRNGALTRVYRTPNTVRSKFLRGEFKDEPKGNKRLKESSADLKNSMLIEAEQIEKLERQLRNAKERQTQDSNLKERFDNSGYSRIRAGSIEDLEDRLSSPNYQYYPPLDADTSLKIEVDGKNYSVYLFDELGATGKKINYPGTLDLSDMLNISLIVKDDNENTVGEIILQLEDKGGAMGYSLMTGDNGSNYVYGEPIGYRTVGYSSTMPTTQYLLNRIGQKYIPMLGQKLTQEGNEYAGFVNDTLKFLPYDETMIRFNDYVMNFVSREEFEDLFEAESYGELVEVQKYENTDDKLINRLNQFESEMMVEGRMESMMDMLPEGQEYTITPSFYDGLDSSDKSILKSLVDWIDGNDPQRAESAQRQLIIVLDEMQKKYRYPNWAFVSNGLLDMISKEDWYEQVLNEAYSKYGADEVEDMLDTDLLQTLMETPTGQQKIKNQWENLIGNMASRSSPFSEDSDAWKTRTDDSVIEKKMKKMKGITNLNMGNLNRTFYRNIGGKRYVGTRPIRNPKNIAKAFRNNGYNARIIPTAQGQRIYLSKKRFRI